MRIVVTRPEREAQAWSQALTRHGFEVLALPLIAIHPITDASAIRSAWQAVGDYAAIMFVSGSAADNFFAHKPPGGLPLSRLGAAGTRAWATGPGTAAALLRHGVEAARIDAPSADSGSFDSEALWALVQSEVRADDRILIVRGGDRTQSAAVRDSDSADPGLGWGRDWLGQRLVEAGARVEFVKAYVRAIPVFDPSQLQQARAAASDGSIWLFTSAQAISNLTTLMTDQSWTAARALATHQRIAEAAYRAGFGVVWESRPRLADVVASIESNA